MGLVCKYRTMFLEFPKKKVGKIFLGRIYVGKKYIRPPGGDGRGSHLGTRTQARRQDTGPGYQNPWILKENHGF